MVRLDSQQLSEFIEDLVIKDIDSALYKYLYFYRTDTKNCFVSDRKKLVQKISAKNQCKKFLCLYYSLWNSLNNFQEKNLCQLL